MGELALEFSHDQIPLSSGGSLNLDGLGIRYSETTALPLKLELMLGRIGVRHDGNPAALGFQADGYTAGINLSLSSPRWRSLQAGVDGSYRYHTADQQLDQQRVAIRWHQAEARGWLALHIHPRAKLYGCAIAANIDGSQSTIAPPSQLNLKNSQRSGYCAGITLEVGDGGYIGIEAVRRHQSSERLYFGQRYGF